MINTKASAVLTSRAPVGSECSEGKVKVFCANFWSRPSEMFLKGSTYHSIQVQLGVKRRFLGMEGVCLRAWTQENPCTSSLTNTHTLYSPTHRHTHIHTRAHEHTHTSPVPYTPTHTDSHTETRTRFTLITFTNFKRKWRKVISVILWKRQKSYIRFQRLFFQYFFLLSPFGLASARQSASLWRRGWSRCSYIWLQIILFFLRQ